MIYVKFDESNKSAEMRTGVLETEAANYVAVSDDTLFGKRLVRVKNKVREFTKSEYEAEAEAQEKTQKAIVIDSMARASLRDTAYLVEPDFYEGLTAEEKATVKAYRDALRNISKQKKYPEHVEFPDKPNL